MTQPTDRTGSPGPVDAPHELGPSDAELAERIVDSRVLHRGRYLTFRVDTIERADGSRSERDIAGHPGAVAIVAIDAADRVVLVRQWRTPVGGILLELPAGGLDPDEDAGTVEDPALAARRELEEETGFRAGTWRRISSFWSAPGFTSELMHLFVATDLEPAHPDDRRGPDEDEHLRVVRMPFDDAVAAVERGEIVDAKSIVGLLWVARERAAARDREDRERREAWTAVPARDAALNQDADATRGATVDVTWRPTMSDIVLGAAAQARRSRVGLVFSTLVLIAGVYWLLTVDVIGALPALVIGIGGLTGFLVAPVVAWTVWRNRDRFLADVRITVGPAGITYRSATIQSTTGWTAVTRIAESGRFLFIELGPQVVLIGLRAFSDADLHEIRRLAAGAGFGPDGRRHGTTTTGS